MPPAQSPTEVAAPIAEGAREEDEDEGYDDNFSMGEGEKQVNIEIKESHKSLGQDPSTQRA